MPNAGRRTRAGRSPRPPTARHPRARRGAPRPGWRRRRYRARRRRRRRPSRARVDEIGDLRFRLGIRTASTALRREPGASQGFQARRSDRGTGQEHEEARRSGSSGIWRGRRAPSRDRASRPARRDGAPIGTSATSASGRAAPARSRRPTARARAHRRRDAAAHMLPKPPRRGAHADQRIILDDPAARRSCHSRSPRTIEPA